MSDGRTLNVGYGVLDMRVGQGLDVVERQLIELKQPVSEWYFDIIHTPNQTPTALRVIGYVEDMIKHRSGLDDKHITVNLNTDAKKVLRARNALFKKAYEANVETVDQKVVGN